MGGSPGKAGELRLNEGKAGGGEYLDPIVDRLLRGLNDEERVLDCGTDGAVVERAGTTLEGC